MDLGLSSRVYLVTGGSRGLGLAAAEALSPTGRTSSSARLTRRRPPPPPPPGFRRTLAAKTRFGRLDGAPVSVGGTPPGTIATTTDEAWRGESQGPNRC